MSAMDNYLVSSSHIMWYSDISSCEKNTQETHLKMRFNEVNSNNNYSSICRGGWYIDMMNLKRNELYDMRIPKLLYKINNGLISKPLHNKYTQIKIDNHNT